MVFHIRKEERFIVDKIAQAAQELDAPAYLVGGFVRDRVLGRGTKDIDIVCVGSGIELARKVASKLRPSPRVVSYSRFGTAMLKHEQVEIEFVGARRESYRMDSRKPVVEDGSLEDDQNRRDFTINALAVSLNEADFGQIVDPFNGLLHLEQKLIKTPLEPGRTFSDDPLRMMRAIRFATQLNFEIDHDTWQAICKYCNRIHIVSKERISTEFNKIMSAPQPSIGLKLLFDSGLLTLILPDVAALQGIEVRNGRAHKDNFYHTLEVVDNLAANSQDIWLRWAALLHDVAKTQTKRFDPKVGWTFHGHEALGAVMVPRIFQSLRLPLDRKMKFVQKLVKLHLRPISLTKEEITDSAIRRLIVDAGEDLDALLMLCEADITSKNREKRLRYIQNYVLVRDKIQEVEEKDRLRSWQPPIDGIHIMTAFGIGPSPQVGQIKNAVRDAILDGDVPNQPEAAFRFMLDRGLELGLAPAGDPGQLLQDYLAAHTAAARQEASQEE